MWGSDKDLPKETEVNSAEAEFKQSIMLIEVLGRVNSLKEEAFASEARDSLLEAVYYYKLALNILKSVTNTDFADEDQMKEIKESIDSKVTILEERIEQEAKVKMDKGLQTYTSLEDNKFEKINLAPGIYHRKTGYAFIEVKRIDQKVYVLKGTLTFGNGSIRNFSYSGPISNFKSIKIGRGVSGDCSFKLNVKSSSFQLDQTMLGCDVDFSGYYFFKKEEINKAISVEGKLPSKDFSELASSPEKSSVINKGIHQKKPQKDRPFSKSNKEVEDNFFYKKECDRGERYACLKLGQYEEKQGNLAKAKLLYKEVCDSEYSDGCKLLNDLEGKHGQNYSK